MWCDFDQNSVGIDLSQVKSIEAFRSSDPDKREYSSGTQKDWQIYGEMQTFTDAHCSKTIVREKRKMYLC